MVEIIVNPHKETQSSVSLFRPHASTHHLPNTLDRRWESVTEASKVRDGPQNLWSFVLVMLLAWRATHGGIGPGVRQISLTRKAPAVLIESFLLLSVFTSNSQEWMENKLALTSRQRLKNTYGFGLFCRLGCWASTTLRQIKVNSPLN